MQQQAVTMASWPQATAGGSTVSALPRPVLGSRSLSPSPPLPPEWLPSSWLAGRPDHGSAVRNDGASQAGAVAAVVAPRVSLPPLRCQWPLRQLRADSRGTLLVGAAGGCLLATGRSAVSTGAAVRHVAGRKGHRRAGGVLARRAVREEDENCRAVGEWIDQCVIGLQICPWARPAKEARRLRVVSSTAITEDEVLADLLQEAQKLPQEDHFESTEGVVTTTLLVCPHVSAWKDFDAFYAYFVNELGEGEALAESLGLTVVAFHPDYSVHDSAVDEGDRVVLEVTENGDEVIGTIMETLGDPSLEQQEQQQLARVRADDGSVRTVAFPLHDESADFANLASRAPRPCLHLLRNSELDRATGDEEAIVQRREMCEHHLRDLGVHGVEEVLRRCG